MYQVAVCICNFMVFSITMSGWPSWVTQMTESPPCHDRVPLLQVSPCVTPHVANQNMTSNETDIDIKDISFLLLIRNVPGCCLYLQFHGVLCYNVWVTQLGDRDGRVTSLPWPSPSASGVSMCHSPCGKPKHDKHVWVTQMAESPPCHDRVPLLQVSPCVTPHVANQNMTSNETIYTSKIFLVLMRNLRRTMKWHLLG